MGKGGLPCQHGDVENPLSPAASPCSDSGDEDSGSNSSRRIMGRFSPREEMLYSPRTAMNYISRTLSARSTVSGSESEAAFLTIKVKQGQTKGNLVELNFSGRRGDLAPLSIASGKILKQVSAGEVSLYSTKGGRDSDGVQIAIDNVGFAIHGDAGCCGCLQAPKRGKLKVDENGLHHVLRNISGIHEAGRLLAILGPSGAGKTTFLNILGGNLKKTSGQIILNGEEACSPTDISEISAFVHQDDCLLSTMTVRETILFAAHMRLPYDMSNSKKAQRAANAIRLLGLEKCENTIIGSSIEGTRGVSGGERKRCAIATELLTNPSIVFLDEPSSGLDAYCAYSLGSVLKTLCNMGKTVVMTIHQPSSDLYDLFDDMLLLASGQTVFWGPASESVDYFCGLGYSCPPFSNPCDYFFLHVLNIKSGPTGDKKLAELHEAWGASVMGNQIQADLSLKISESSITIKDIVLQRMKACVPFWRKIMLLTKRGFRHFFRNRMLLPSRLLQALLSTLVALAVFWDISENQTGIMARSGVLFYFVAGTMFTSVLSVLSAFSSERSVFIREYSNGAYSVFVYFCSKILVEYPFQIVIPVVIAASSYFAVGLQATGLKFAVFCVSLVMVNLCGTNIGLMLSSAFRDVAVALSLAPLFVLPFMLFSGFFISYEDVPAYVAWLQAISPVRYAFAALMQNEFNGLELHCTPSQEMVPDGIPGIENLPKALLESIPPICPIQKGEQYIELYGFDLVDTKRCLIMLGILLVMTLILAYAALFLTAAKSRGKSLLCLSTYVSSSNF